MKLVFSIIFLFVVSNNLFSQKTTIAGKAVDYAGKEISFYTYTEPILHQKVELGTTKVAEDGSFGLIVSIKETTEIYADLEKYRGTIVVQPDKNYDISLPPFTPRTAIEARSAFFEPALYWLGILSGDKNDINLKIRKFITVYNQETANQTNEIYLHHSKKAAKKIIDQLEKQFPDDTDPYFNTLKLYYFADLENVVSQQNKDEIIGKYFARNTLEISHPAYQKLFQSLFNDFLSQQARNIKNAKISTMVDSGNYPGLVGFYVSMGYSKYFAELAVTKGLYDGYYSKAFNKDGVLKALVQAQTATTLVPLKPTIRQIVQKLSTMKTGGKAPAFNLQNRSGKNISLDAYKDKFVYLVFFRSDSKESVAELDSLVSIEKKMRQVITIVPVTIDNNFASAEKLWNEKKYPFDLLNGTKQKKLIADYEIRVAPTFYLLAPDGTFLLAQAPPPSRDFESLFLKVFRDYNFKHPQNRLKP